MSAPAPETAAHYPWLSAARQQVTSAAARARLPHALLIHSAPGLGDECLALWIAAFVLCDSTAESPCGRCASCRLIAAGSHPDLSWVTREEDAKQLQIDQIRAICDVLALKSYRGGYKVAVIAQADLMTVSAANALLKTLEEPPPGSLVILCSSRPARLPATIVSRCQRLTIATPPRAAALEWLRGQDSTVSWDGLLEFAGGAPLRAIELRGARFDDLHHEMSESIERLGDSTLDIPGVAERWARDALATRLEWIETWVTNSIRETVLNSADLQSNDGIRKIRSLYGVLDQARRTRLELTTSLNAQLATEELLLRAEAVLAGRGRESRSRQER
jgi:DNA polymerase-3 subunit delta'